MKLLAKNDRVISDTASLWQCCEFNFSTASIGAKSADSDEFYCIFNNNETMIKIPTFARSEEVIAVRFMPQIQGEWQWKLVSICGDEIFSGNFQVGVPEPENRGLVRVHDKYHFAYADCSIYRPFGTTSYGCAHQPEAIVKQTLQSLENSPFNKIRLCVLPHYSKWSEEHTEFFPFVKNGDDWDYSSFDYRYFDRLDELILSLQRLGIEADLILFHPYSDKWAFDKMPADVDDRYVSYVTRRYAAFSNVWWSLANEYDLLKEKVRADWVRFGKIIAAEDPYAHLCSNHNYISFYDYSLPEMSHCCIQDGLAVAENGRAVMLRNAWHKPVIYDEVCYEGNFDVRWGNLDDIELAHRFWEGIAGGTYVGHGEVWTAEGHTDDEVWTGIGGELRGRSKTRIKFLREVLEAGPECGLEPIDRWWYTNIVGVPGEYYLFYFGRTSPGVIPFYFPARDLSLPDGTKFKAAIIDTLDMKIITVPGSFSSCKRGSYEYGDENGRIISLPDKPYLALRIEKAH